MYAYYPRCLIWCHILDQNICNFIFRRYINLGWRRWSADLIWLSKGSDVGWKRLKNSWSIPVGADGQNLHDSPCKQSPFLYIYLVQSISLFIFRYASCKAYLYVLLRPWQTRTHCCGHIVADPNVSPFARARNICCGHKFCVFVQKHFVSATNVSQFAQPKKHHGQQCVRNNVSSFELDRVEKGDSH